MCRREFIEAIDTKYHLEFNRKILRLIRHLYRIERYVSEKGFSAEQRFDIRQRCSKSILKKIKDALTNPGETIVP
jgi:hypothetical protein